MVKQTVAGLVAAIVALGMTTVVSAQGPKPAETMDKKAEPAGEKVEKKKAEKKSAKKKQAKAEKKMEKPAEEKK